jgi:drug/metabolite transporter (DMT)-like permease
MAVWGLNLSAIKVLTSSVDTLALVTLRMILATIAISWFAAPHLAILLRMKKRQMIRLGLCAALMVYGNQLLLVSGMRFSSATNAAVIVALSPLSAFGVAALVLRERMKPASIVGVVIGMAGVLAVVLARPGVAVAAGGIGDVLILLSVISFALGGALVQSLSLELDTVVISWVTYTAGTTMLLIHAVCTMGYSAFPLSSLGWSTWGLLLFSGAVAAGLGSIAWNKSISVIGVGRTTSALNWVPLFGIGFAILALEETPSVWHPVGLIAVLFGTWISKRGLAREPRPALKSTR